MAHCRRLLVASWILGVCALLAGCRGATDDSSSATDESISTTSSATTTTTTSGSTSSPGEPHDLVVFMQDFGFSTHAVDCVQTAGLKARFSNSVDALEGCTTEGETKQTIAQFLTSPTMVATYEEIPELAIIGIEDLLSCLDEVSEATPESEYFAALRSAASAYDAGRAVASLMMSECAISTLPSINDDGSKVFDVVVRAIDSPDHQAMVDARLRHEGLDFLVMKEPVVLVLVVNPTDGTMVSAELEYGPDNTAIGDEVFKVLLLELGLVVSVDQFQSIYGTELADIPVDDIRICAATHDSGRSVRLLPVSVRCED